MKNNFNISPISVTNFFNLSVENFYLTDFNITQNHIKHFRSSFMCYTSIEGNAHFKDTIISRFISYIFRLMVNGNYIRDNVINIVNSRKLFNHKDQIISILDIFENYINDFSKFRYYFSYRSVIIMYKTFRYGSVLSNGIYNLIAFLDKYHEFINDDTSLEDIISNNINDITATTEIELQDGKFKYSKALDIMVGHDRKISHHSITGYEREELLYGTQCTNDRYNKRFNNTLNLYDRTLCASKNFYEWLFITSFENIVGSKYPIFILYLLSGFDPYNKVGKLIINSLLKPTVSGFINLLINLNLPVNIIYPLYVIYLSKASLFNNFFNRCKLPDTAKQDIVYLIMIYFGINVLDVTLLKLTIFDFKNRVVEPEPITQVAVELVKKPNIAIVKEEEIDIKDYKLKDLPIRNLYIEEALIKGKRMFKIDLVKANFKMSSKQKSYIYEYFKDELSLFGLTQMNAFVYTPIMTVKHLDGNNYEISENFNESESSIDWLYLINWNAIFIKNLIGREWLHESPGELLTGRNSKVKMLCTDKYSLAVFPYKFTFETTLVNRIPKPIDTYFYSEENFMTLESDREQFDKIIRWYYASIFNINVVMISLHNPYTIMANQLGYVIKPGEIINGVINICVDREGNIHIFIYIFEYSHSMDRFNDLLNSGKYAPTYVITIFNNEKLTQTINSKNDSNYNDNKLGYYTLNEDELVFNRYSLPLTTYTKVRSKSNSRKLYETDMGIIKLNSDIREIFQYRLNELLLSKAGIVIQDMTPACVDARPTDMLIDQFIRWSDIMLVYNMLLSPSTLMNKDDRTSFLRQLSALLKLRDFMPNGFKLNGKTFITPNGNRGVLEELYTTIIPDIDIKLLTIMFNIILKQRYKYSKIAQELLFITKDIDLDIFSSEI